MKTAIYNLLKDDHDFINVYKEYNNESTWGYKTILKECINLFISDFNIYLSKPYLDISYMIYRDKLIDLDLLFDIFKNAIKEKRKENFKGFKKVV